MRILNRTIVIVILITFGLNAFTSAQKRMDVKLSGESAALIEKIRRFAPTVMTANTARLAANDRKALQKIIAAAKLYDPLYQRQIWSGNESLLKTLEADKTPPGRLRLHYFKINQGPWSQLDENEPFIDGVPRRPPQANFYPEDLTKDEFNEWLNTLS